MKQLESLEIIFSDAEIVRIEADYIKSIYLSGITQELYISESDPQIEEFYNAKDFVIKIKPNFKNEKEFDYAFLYRINNFEISRIILYYNNYRHHTYIIPQNKKQEIVLDNSKNIIILTSFSKE